MRYIWKSNLHTELNIIGFVGVNLSTNGWKKFSRIEPNKKFVKQQNVRTYRVSKKLSFTDLSIFRFAKNIISISSELAAGSPNAQFGKTQFFHTPSIFFSSTAGKQKEPYESQVLSPIEECFSSQGTFNDSTSKMGGGRNYKMLADVKFSRI